MLKRILSYFWGSNETNVGLSLEEAYKILESDNESPENTLSTNENVTSEGTTSEYVCYRRSGKITSAVLNNYEVDEIYTFQSDLQNLTVGTSVTYTAYIINDKINICNVAVVCDDWDCRDEVKKFWSYRDLITKVVKKNGRFITVSPGDLTVDLNAIPSDFVPVVGDWLELESKVEIEEKAFDLFGKILSVDRIRPLRAKVQESVIKQWDGQIGNVGNNSVFDKDALKPGYIPAIGDKVIVEAIESDRRPWRAVRVLPKPKLQEESYVQNISGVDINIHVQELSEQINIIVQILNSSEKIVLKNITFEGDNSQLKLVSALTWPKILEKDMACTILYTAKCSETMKELVLFHIDDIKVGRWVKINFKSNIIRNRRELKTTPNFMVTGLPDYGVPQKLWNLLAKGNDCTETLEQQKQCLVLPLSFDVYEDCFHTLLHIFEIQDLIELQCFNKEQVRFIEIGDYFMLEIEDLSERRPSLAVGDRVMAKDPYDPDETESEGYIRKIGSEHIHIKFAQIFHDNYNGEYMSVRVIKSRTDYRRMHQAVGLAVRNLRAKILFPSKVVEKDPQIHFTCGHREQIRFAEDAVLNLDWYNKSLNLQQQEAVKNILTGKGRPLPYIIFGPPGTGKTATLIESILQILRLMPHSRLLVAAPSNSAADFIALRLIDYGILKPGDILRLVTHRYANEDCIPMELVPYSATFHMAREGTYCHQVEVTEKPMSLGCGSAVIGRHRITVGACSALSGFFSSGFAKGHFTHIFIDEAEQSMEPEIMIPLSFLDRSNGQAVLAGDPMQLGPIVHSKLANHYGLGKSYLERLLSQFLYIKDPLGFPDTGGYDPRLVTKLICNYRSLPSILSLSSNLFYNSELTATISASDSTEAQLLQQIKEILPQRTDGPFPMLFHGVQADNNPSLDSQSWYNPNEISWVFYYVNELFRLGVSAKDIGIVTPYVKQAREICNVLVEAEFELPKIGTIEEFQGQDLIVILLATVRTTESFLNHDERCCLGFVANPKRLNVALTRARALLIIIGNPFLLSIDNYWSNVLDYCIKNNVYCGCKFVAAT